jgi:hypothetical protein
MLMRRGAIAAVVLAACLGAGVAQARHHGHSGAASPVDGRWNAAGVVVVARHISNVKKGDRFTKPWSIKTACTGGGRCHTELSYGIGGSTVQIPLHGSGRSWSGELDHRVFACTNGGTATGSLAFKLRVSSFTRHGGRKVAQAMKATGVQSGTGCATIREVVDFKVTRTGF